MQTCGIVEQEQLKDVWELAKNVSARMPSLYLGNEYDGSRELAVPEWKVRRHIQA